MASKLVYRLNSADEVFLVGGDGRAAIAVLWEWFECGIFEMQGVNH